MRKRTKKRVSGLLRGIAIPLLAVAVVLMFFTGISNISEGSGDEGKRQLEESIRRAAAACYAAEGIYPPTVEYMEENYGLLVDEDKYYIDYIVFAENLMPDFTVLEVSGGGPAGAETHDDRQGSV